MSQTCTAKHITRIPQRLEFNSRVPLHQQRRRLVAAYARVSTDSEEQATSYEAQVKYYTEYIQSNPEWDYIQVYADEGISGTSMKKRDNFNRMIADALDGKIDLIVTKTIARFARNTVDTLTTIRKLKEHGVEVYFESQGIYSFDSKCEFVISVMASIAQEESRNISENVTWGKRKRAAEGAVYLPYGQFLGYKKGEDGLPEIDREGAELSLMLCQMYLDGYTYLGIADRLTELGIPTPGGKRVWRTSTVRSILFNEKRRGDALLLKTYTVDYLSHRIRRNRGEVEQYFVENSHPAIFSRELAAMLDMEKERRERIGNSYNGAGVFSSRIVCGDCGGLYGPKVWSSNTKYRRTIWRCNRKYNSGEKVCSTPHLTEEEIIQAFLVSLKMQAENLGLIRDSVQSVIAGVLDTAKLEKKHSDLQEHFQGAMSQAQALIARNSREVISQEDFQAESRKLADRCSALTAEINEVGRKIAEIRGRKAAIDVYLSTLEQVKGLPIEFSRRLWNMTVDTLTVYEGKRLVFRWKDGTTNKWGLALNEYWAPPICLRITATTRR